MTKAETTVLMDDKALLQKYRIEIEELRNKLHDITVHEQESSALAAEKMRLEEELAQQQLVRNAFKERIDHLTKLILTSSSFSNGPIVNAFQAEDSLKMLTKSSGSLGGSQSMKKRNSFVPDPDEVYFFFIIVQQNGTRHSR